MFYACPVVEADLSRDRVRALAVSRKLVGIDVDVDDNPASGLMLTCHFFMGIRPCRMS
jgi:hypothetical protein